jgi:N6-L-threonylcarbamoyladenine synthase
MALLVSGGHTELNLMRGHLHYERLGGTLDDAAGEAFDKTSRVLGLPYPGGPEIQKVAALGNARAYPFPRTRLDGKWDFSFSGIKTAVLRKVESIKVSGRPIPVNDLAASFQAMVVETLFNKTMQAAQEYQVKSIVVAGGVSANLALRNAFLNQQEFPVHIPILSYCTDNAGMIGVAGYQHFVAGEHHGLDMDVLPTWPLT